MSEKNRRPARRRLRLLCAEVHPDDGADPRFDPPIHASGRKVDHRAQALCRQAAEAIDQALADSPQEELLGELTVVRVDPAPDSARLLVTVGPRPAARAVDPAAILTALDRANSRLRREVAAAITRRKTPTLAFRVIVAGAEVDD